MTKITKLDRIGRQAAEQYRELADFKDAMKPVETEFNDTKTTLHQTIVEMWDSDVDLSNYLAGSDGFLFEDLQVRIKVAVHKVPCDVDDKQLTSIDEQLAKTAEKLEVLKARRKARMDVLKAEGKLNERMSKIVPTFTKTAS